MSIDILEQKRVDGPGSGLGSHWNVIVKNDNHNTFDHVAASLARMIPRINLEKGYAIADLIHKSGQAIVWCGLKEPAEFYWEQLDGVGLTMAALEEA